MWFTSIKDEKCSLSAKVLFMNYFPWAGENEVSQNGVVKKKPKPGSIVYNEDNMHENLRSFTVPLTEENEDAFNSSFISPAVPCNL